MRGTLDRTGHDEGNDGGRCGEKEESHSDSEEEKESSSSSSSSITGVLTAGLLLQHFLRVRIAVNHIHFNQDS